MHKEIEMRPLILDLINNDDRMHVFTINKSESRSINFNGDSLGDEKHEWAVVTRRNNMFYSPIRVESFRTKKKALDYYLKIVVSTPRVSLGNKPPKKSPSIKEYKDWLIEKRLHDPILNPVIKEK